MCFDRMSVGSIPTVGFFNIEVTEWFKVVDCKFILMYEFVGSNPILDIFFS